MSTFRRRHRSSLDLLLCGGSSSVSTVVEEDEGDDDTENDVSHSQSSHASSNHNSILSTPTRTINEKIPLHQGHHQPSSPSRVMSPTSVSSPSTPCAMNDYDDEPSSPVEWYYDRGNCNQDDDEPPPPPPSFVPSFFTTTPWMCVFDLDAACGGDDDIRSILDVSQPYDHSSPSVDPPSLGVGRRQQHENWNALLPTVMDLSQWFGGGQSCNDSSYGSSTVHKQSSTDITYADERDDPKLLLPPPLPLSPTSVRHPIGTITPTMDHYSPSILPTQLFTNFATNCEVETIYYNHPALEQLSRVDDMIPGADAKGANNRRRAPTAQASMSLTPAAAAQLTKKVVSSSGKHEHHYHGRSEDFRVASDAMELVLVKTPGADRSALKELASLRDAPPAKREELFVLKLQLCSVIFSFDDPTADKRGKDMKRQTLLELVDYVNTPAGQKIFTESIMGDLMAMVSANVCRALPPVTDDFDPEEDEPVLEPAWPHLQVAYEFFLRFIVSSEVNAKAAKKYVDQKFCLQLVELFDSEDPRERDYLKTILHRIYGKFMSHRSFIRRAISNVFYRFVYETERHNGIGELLEILGSIINGFAIPLKKEHLQFLVRALIPLHKPKCVALYHQQLSYCIIQYVEKDADTATPILNGFFKCWPWSCSGKQVMFLNELEEILELLGADQLAQVSNMLFTNLARCLDCDHFQVVERALFLWNNEHLVNSGCLSRLNAHTVLPIIYGPLYKNSSGHWNATVEGLAQNVLKMYMEYDLALYDKCTAAYFQAEEEAKKRLEALAEKWHAIEQEAYAMAPEIMAK